MPDTVAAWLALVDDLYPPGHALSWDAVGLQVGDPAWDVARVLVSLDVTSAVIDEAAAVAGTFVLAHHPLLLRPLARLTPATAAGKVALAAARSGVAVAAAHTNLDVATDGAGTSDPVVTLLDLRDVAPLAPALRDQDSVKLVTFVPLAHTDEVLDALVATGAGTIGDYDRCSFRVQGTGTFRPRPGAEPFIGTVGEDNAEAEDRLEVVVPRRSVAAAVRALRDAHPYEEVAFDLYPMVTGADVGIGRIGDLPAPRRLDELAATIRERLPSPHLRIAGDPERSIRRVAVVGGAGDALVGDAIAAGADLLVTGDLRHHVVLDALELGLAMIDAGHHATESAALPGWLARLERAARERGLTADLLRSAASTEPWAG